MERYDDGWLVSNQPKLSSSRFPGVDKVTQGKHQHMSRVLFLYIILIVEYI